MGSEGLYNNPAYSLISGWRMDNGSYTYLYFLLSRILNPWGEWFKQLLKENRSIGKTVVYARGTHTTWSQYSASWTTQVSFWLHCCLQVHMLCSTVCGPRVNWGTKCRMWWLYFFVNVCGALNAINNEPVPTVEMVINVVPNCHWSVQKL
jgi:hypothetical protein